MPLCFCLTQMLGDVVYYMFDVHLKPKKYQLCFLIILIVTYTMYTHFSVSQRGVQYFWKRGVEMLLGVCVCVTVFRGAVAQSIGTWLGNRRVAGSSPPHGPSTECELVAGEMLVCLLGTAEVPLSKASKPQLLWAPVRGSPLALTSLH